MSSKEHVDDHRTMTTWRLTRGATIVEGGVRFEVWAPRVRQMQVRIVAPIERRVPMARTADGVHAVFVPDLAAGADYLYALDGRAERPDPVSRRQPHGVHGPSRVVDPAAHAWRDGAWRGRPLLDYVTSELHIGTFTREGTFDSAIARLEHLRETGITAVELMPVSSFPGTRNWGYDGVHHYAPQESYGGPDGLKRLVDAAHEADLAVITDVVYNHLGPEGNYLREFGPYFTDRHKTPWGEGINFDGDAAAEVRRWFIENALYWITEFHCDALRLDAIHGIIDASDPHVLQEIAAAVHAEAERLGRPAYLIAENCGNDPQVTRAAEDGGFGLDSQWSDHFHHALRVVTTGEHHGYLAPFGKMAHLEKAVRIGFVHPGHDIRTGAEVSIEKTGFRGERFTVCAQNHDQISNTSAGRRLTAMKSLAAERAALSVVVAAPNLPLLFMGEEYGETNPFYFFTDFQDPSLVEIVRTGRVREMKELGLAGGDADPFALETFDASRLDWDKLRDEKHAAHLRYVRDLLALRRHEPALHNGRNDLTRTWSSESARWIAIERSDPAARPIRACVTLSDAPCRIALPPSGAWELLLFSGDARYGDAAPSPPATWRGETLALPAHAAAIYGRKY